MYGMCLSAHILGGVDGGLGCVMKDADVLYQGFNKFK